MRELGQCLSDPFTGLVLLPQLICDQIPLSLCGEPGCTGKD